MVQKARNRRQPYHVFATLATLYFRMRHLRHYILRYATLRFEICETTFRRVRHLRDYILKFPTLFTIVFYIFEGSLQLIFLSVADVKLRDKVLWQIANNVRLSSQRISICAACGHFYICKGNLVT